MAVTLIERLPSHFELKIHFPSQCNGTAKNSLFGRAEKIWRGVGGGEEEEELLV